MTTFKPKRVSGAELAEQIESATRHLPLATGPSPRAERERPPPKVQVNFQASEAMADLLAREAEKAGSLRRFIARLLREKGYEVLEADVNPVDTRKRGRGLG
jgi:hypothetical protein